MKHGWTPLLRKALDAADRICVRTGGASDSKGIETLFEVSDATKVRAVVEQIRLVNWDVGNCGCGGNPTLEFYVGTVHLLTLSVHHGFRLRWRGGEWPGDADLTKESADFLCDWLARNGVHGPKKERAEARK